MNNKITNINVISEHGLMKYLFEYIEKDLKYINCNTEDGPVVLTKLNNGQYDMHFRDLDEFKNLPITRVDLSLWVNFDGSVNLNVGNLPEKINVECMRIYFPEYSVDTFNDVVNYAVNIYVIIYGIRVCINSVLINRINSLALNPPIKKIGLDYYEYVDVLIPNPNDIAYADEWEDFRRNIIEHNYHININDVETTITMTLHPVVYDKAHKLYHETDVFTGGQNSLSIYNTSNYMHVKLDYEILDLITFKIGVEYNPVYKNDLEKYLKETYNMSRINSISYELIFQDDLDIYKKLTKTYSDVIDHTEMKKYFVDSTDLGDVQTLSFANWKGWKPGIFIISYVVINGITENTLDGEIITKNCELFLVSNRIPFTKEIMKYLITDTSGLPNRINLNNIDMNIFNINAVNKVENKIIKMENPEDNKSNIIAPVFFKSMDSSNIVCHPDVTENICLNLDIYKSNVTTFKLQIEKIVFPETGRLGNGVVFKIVGNKLPKESVEGIYYVLNENNELVTTGNYKYIM